MDALLKKICALLDSKDVELQCSAALVLGELRPKSAEVRLKLARHLKNPNLTVKNYVLSALERNTGKEALPFLFPLLSEGGNIQERARRIITSTGSSAVSETKKYYAKADEELKKQLIRILGMIGTQEACNFIIDSISGAGTEIGKTICLALREAMGRMSREKKRTLLKKVNAFLASPQRKDHPEETASGIILLGYITDNATIGKLLKYTAPLHPVSVRKQALVALSRMDIPAKSRAEVAQTIIPFLDEDDYPRIVRNALELLRRIEIPKVLLKGLGEGLKNRRLAVRSFIISRMGRFDSRESIGMLMRHLRSTEFQERRAAQEALANIPAAYPRIIEELDVAQDYEVSMRLISIIKVQGDQLGPRDKNHLLTRMERLWGAGDERYSIFATALKAVDKDFLVEKVLNRVKRLKAARKFKESDKMLLILTRHSLLSDEVKYEMAVATLRGGSGDLSPLRRKNDECLKLIAELLRKAEFPLLKRLKADKAVSPENLFYVGFHFSEKLFEKKEFGVALLKYLVKKSPRSKVGRAAKEKLRLLGIKA